ncbi:MAG TPA: FxLYD domain-containing protein [Vicinamibacterales bacterium]|jgi:hypothetical protein|nr:FxLYD domain-containing protein [Vicinamibacterales bacterium]
MDATLITVTVLSMTMAAALSAIVWRMLRLERQRSNARVASLAAVALRPERPGRVVEKDLLLVPQAEGRGPALGPPDVSGAGMFVARAPESPWRARFAVMLALALVIASAVLFSLAARAPKAHGARGAATANVTQTTGTPSGAELELMALHDSRQTGSLTITGLVQNPRSGAHLSRVAVTAYTFDDKGSFLASGRALLDVTALAPGDESPFTVTVPVTDNVARYRVGFRDETGRVIAHIDRRQPGPVASNWQ